MPNYVDNQFATDPAVLTTHGASLTALGAAIMGYLPAFVALIPAIYYCILIFESKTVQRWIKCHRIKKIALRRAISKRQWHAPHDKAK